MIDVEICTVNRFMRMNVDNCTNKEREREREREREKERERYFLKERLSYINPRTYNNRWSQPFMQTTHTSQCKIGTVSSPTTSHKDKWLTRPNKM